MQSEPPKDAVPATRRIASLDLARAAALVAMAVYHFTWDLEFFGYVQPGLTAVGGWKLFARCIASSFLVLAGVSLFLAHRDGIRWPPFRRRLAMVAGAALAISAITYVAIPAGFIFFGILHQIALASLLGLAFLRLPWLANLVIAAAVVAAPVYLRSPVFDHPALWWVGLSATTPRSNDYVPLFPWFGAVLAGIAAAQVADAYGLPDRLARIGFGAWSRPFLFLGRHSLPTYLIHQPVLIGCVWLAAQVFPPTAITPEVGFRYSCEATCGQTRDGEFCAGYCACMLDRLEAAGDLRPLLAGDQSDAMRERVRDTAAICAAAQEDKGLQEDTP